jgi:hypothetical protein
VRGKDNPGGLPIDRAFDADFANALARYESYNKHLYRPNTYLHKWWARRCGTTFRLLLKHLVEDETQRGYYEAGGLEGKVILDPMMGGGTTLHEAIRMGANVIGADIDPIPILQARATLSDVPLATLEAAFESYFEQMTAELSPYFETACVECERPSTLRFMLYGLKRYCACGEAVFVDSFVLRQETNGTVIRICPNCYEVSDEACDCEPVEGKRPLQLKRTKRCPDCQCRFRDDFETPFYQRYVPLVRVGYCKWHKMFFDGLIAADLELLETADKLRATLPPDPTLAVHAGPKSGHLSRRGIHYYADLFSSRQLMYLHHSIKVLEQFEPVVRLNLALLVSTSLEFNSMLCGYKGSAARRSGAIRHAFSYHAFYFPYMALENNPLNSRKSSGTLKKLFHSRLRRARRWAERPVERLIGQNGNGTVKKVVEGETDYGREVSGPEAFQERGRQFWLRQGSSTELPLADNSVDFIVTDPPYFDSVQYSDLATFFRVWLEKMLPEGTQDGICWSYDLNGSAVAEHKSNGIVDEKRLYEGVMGRSFGECHRVLKKEGGRLIFTYHHWNPESWAAITAALKRTGFVLVNRYVVHSENPISVHIAGFRALTDDTILVLAPKEAGIEVQWERPERVNTAESAAFCQDCGTLVGWLLGMDGLLEDEIYQVWEEQIMAVAD